MIELLIAAVSAAAGGFAVAARMKGKKTWREVGAIVFGGGGPGDPDQ